MANKKPSIKEEKTTLTLSILPSDKKLFKILAAKKNTTMGELLHQWINEYGSEQTDKEKEVMKKINEILSNISGKEVMAAMKVLELSGEESDRETIALNLDNKKITFEEDKNGRSLCCYKDVILDVETFEEVGEEE